MDSIQQTASAASSATAGTVQSAASVSVLKKAIDLQAHSVVQLIASLPQPALATSGTLGTALNAYA